MPRFVLSALLALLSAAPFAVATSAQSGIGVYVGPFPSSFIDAAGVASDAVCAYVVRTRLDNGTYQEVAYCYFAGNANLPREGTTRQDEITSGRAFWSDYTYELTGGFETATTWSVTTSWDGTLVAESTYGAEPVDDDSDPFAGWIGAVIPGAEGGVIHLSQDGVRNQVRYGISDAEIIAAWDDGVGVEFEESGVDYEGRWSGGVLVYGPAGNRLLNVRLATWLDVQELQ